MANTKPLWNWPFEDDGLDEEEVKELNSEIEDGYDDLQDHELCDDCKGSGFYVGLMEKKYCPTCDGSGYL